MQQPSSPSSHARRGVHLLQAPRGRLAFIRRSTAAHAARQSAAAAAHRATRSPPRCPPVGHVQTTRLIRRRPVLRCQRAHLHTTTQHHQQSRQCTPTPGVPLMRGRRRRRQRRSEEEEELALACMPAARCTCHTASHHRSNASVCGSHIRARGSATCSRQARLRRASVDECAVLPGWHCTAHPNEGDAPLTRVDATGNVVHSSSTAKAAHVSCGRGLPAVVVESSVP